MVAVTRVYNWIARPAGLCVDLWETLAQRLKFSYTMYEVEDKQYGRKDPVTSQWDGLVSELVHRVSAHEAIMMKS